MDYDAARRCSQNPALAIPHYYFNDRNAPLQSHGTRLDPRVYPMGGPVGGPRGRTVLGREEGTTENGSTRRRSAVACARCRKRKIKCSGDPGNGNVCTNCKQAGVGTETCQFHRVGTVVGSDAIAFSQGLIGMTGPNALIPAYNAAESPMYSHEISNTQYHIDTKNSYAQCWTIPYSEDTSPVEAYSLDQPTTYLPNQSSLIYGVNCRWPHTNSKTMQSSTNTYLAQELSVPSTSTYHGLPYIQTDIRGTAVTESLSSPLNMTSLQSTLPIALPERPRPRQGHGTDATAPQRQLPIPQPSPAQSLRNVVDKLQDQRLRSAQVIGASSVSLNSQYGKSTTSWNAEQSGDIPGTSSELVAQVRASTSIPSLNEASVGFLPVTTSVDETSATNSAAQTRALNFTSPSLLDSMTAPASTNSVYSNFREYRPPTSSSSSEAISLIARQSSHTPAMYSLSAGSGSKRSSPGERSHEHSIVSEHRYTQLEQPQLQHAPSLENPSCNSYEARNASLQRVSMSDLNRTF